MKKVILFLVVLFFSCNLNKGFIDVKYKGYFKMMSNKEYTYRYSLNKGFVIRETQGDEWRQIEYIYGDNSIFYISNEDDNMSLNYENIKAIKETSDQASIAFFERDTITLYGVDNDGKFWKNKYDGEINIGYLNASDSRKEEFEKVISTLIRYSY